jgi:LysM repeat protein/ABC-type branched-subunit amino acid transport system substrate-binding protein
MIRIALSILILLVFLPAYGQKSETETRKHNTVIIAGKRYIIHIVKRGETLFNISKVYDVPYDSITKANPFIIPASLEIGSALKIPFYEKAELTDVKNETPEKQDTQTSPYHLVKQGETVYRISLLYNLKPADIFALNPGSEISIHPGLRLRLPHHSINQEVEIEQDKDFIYHTVKENENLATISAKYGIKLKVLQKINPKIDANKLIVNSKIKIPKQKVEILTELPQQPDTALWHYHQVKPKETLYGIAKLYETTQDIIKKHNNALNDRELLAGEIIKLPVNNIKKHLPEPIVDVIKDTVYQEIAKMPCPCLPKPITKTMHIGLMLPFYTNVNDTLSQTGSIPQIFSRSKQFVEFYQGLLLALQDLKENNLVAELHVFDTQNDQKVVQDIFLTDDFKNLDLIIGPAFSRNIEIVAQEAKKYNIPLVSPLSTDEKFLIDYENAFMISPSQKIQELESIRFISGLKRNSFVIVFDGNQYDSAYIPQLKQQIFSQYTPETVHNLKYTEFAYFKGGESQLIDLFITNDTTVVIIPSSDKAFVSDIVSRLNTLTAQRNLILFGQPRWSRFDNIKLEFFHNLNTHLFALSFPDYDNQKVIDFVTQYRQFFNTEPQSRAFEGYDIAKYFVEAVHLYGKDFRCCLANYHPELLHMQFQLQQLKEGAGYVNHHLFLIHYKRNFDRSIVTVE